MTVTDITVKEKSITNNILKYLKTLDSCFAWKEHGGMYGTSGIPDIICCYKGRFIGIEVKRPGGKLSRLQEAALRKIQAAGGMATVAFSVEDAKSFINSFSNLYVKGDERNRYKGVCGVPFEKLQ